MSSEALRPVDTFLVAVRLSLVHDAACAPMCIDVARYAAWALRLHIFWHQVIHLALA